MNMHRAALGKVGTLATADVRLAWLNDNAKYPKVH